MQAAGASKHAQVHQKQELKGQRSLLKSKMKAEGQERVDNDINKTSPGGRTRRIFMSSEMNNEAIAGVKELFLPTTEVLAPPHGGLFAKAWKPQSE